MLKDEMICGNCIHSEPDSDGQLRCMERIPEYENVDALADFPIVALELHCGQGAWRQRVTTEEGIEFNEIIYWGDWD